MVAENTEDGRRKTAGGSAKPRWKDTLRSITPTVAVWGQIVLQIAIGESTA